MEAFRAVQFGDLPGYRNGRHGNSRGHQKGHMNVYYIEKRKRRTMFPKPYSQGLKKEEEEELECQRKAMLCEFITGPHVYVHVCIWRYVHGFCCCGWFSITRTAAQLEGRGSKLLGSWRSRSPALLLWGSVEPGPKPRGRS